jgi:hypothetical protein
MEWSYLMISRHFLGDLALAALLSIPVAAIAATAHAVHDINPAAMTRQAPSHHSPVDDRFTLFAPN